MQILYIVLYTEDDMCPSNSNLPFRVYYLKTLLNYTLLSFFSLNVAALLLVLIVFNCADIIKEISNFILLFFFKCFIINLHQKGLLSVAL